jgi:O-antigen/teichoic acid export membrane protein
MKSNLRNAVYNAIGFIFPVLVGLFTTPYIVHKLTPEVYGIYVLAISLMGLLSFLDLGFGQGIIKFVSHYEAKGDFKRINDIINTSLFINVIMGLLGAVIIFTFSKFLSLYVFKVKSEHLETSILSFQIVSVGFFLNLLSSTFSNIPKALQRYDVAVKIQNFVWFCSIMSSVLLLYLGYGLVEMMTFYVIFQLLGVFLYYYSSKKLLPTLKLSLSFKKDVFKEIFGFSVYTSINAITGNIVFRVDKMIISYFLGTAAVTYYQIPFMIVQMANGFISSVIQFLMPAVSFINSFGDKEKLKELYIKYTKYLFLTSIIIFSGLVLLGKPFLILWIGNNIAEKSYSLLIIIALVFFFVSISNVGYYFYNGIGKSYINMISSFVGSVSYLVAAVLLVPKYSLIGAAVAFSFILLPYPVYIHYLNKIVGVEQKFYIDLLLKALVYIIVIVMIGFNFILNIAFINSVIVGLLLFLLILTLISFTFISKTDFIEIKRRVLKV